MHAPWQPVWGGPDFVQGNYLNHGSTLYTTVHLVVGGVLFVVLCVLLWFGPVRWLWRRAQPAPGVAAVASEPVAV